MKKQIIILIIGMALISLIVGAGIISQTSLTFDKTDKKILDKKGITMPIISECKKINEFTCRASVYQKGGINTHLDIEYYYCNEWEETEDLETEPKCLKWITLNQAQIEEQLKIKLEERLKNIIQVDKERETIQNILTEPMEVIIT